MQRFREPGLRVWRSLPLESICRQRCYSQQWHNLLQWKPLPVCLKRICVMLLIKLTINLRTLQTAIDNGSNDISQIVKGLTPGKTYTFSAEAQVPESGASYCGIYVYSGHNVTKGHIAEKDVDMGSFGSWLTVTGSYVPKSPTDKLHVAAYCDEEDNSVTGWVYFDAISLVPESGCGSSS